MRGVWLHERADHRGSLLGWLPEVGEFEVAAVSGGRSSLSARGLAELSRLVSNA